MTAADRAPVRSMTGFGTGRREAAGAVAQAEVRSVNGRGLSVSVRAPAAFDARLHDLEALVRARLHRGTVTATVSLRRQRPSAPARISFPVLDDYLRQMVEAGMPAPPTLVGDLLRLPGVVEDAPPAELAAEEFEAARGALDDALSALVEMREREGAALRDDVASLLADAERLGDTVAARSPQAVLAAQQRLRERLAALLADTGVPAELVAREVAVLADRTDVAEEVARLRSHVAQAREAVASGGPVGRRLDFLSQELGREANTIGSKSQDVELARAVVDLKLAVERLKEQAANLE